MKRMVLLMLTLSLMGDEAAVEDLGQITSRRGISLTACERRTDFLEFRIVFFPQTPLKNPVTMTTTNDLILLADLAQLPSGPTIMGVQSICRDSAESPVAFYRFEILRSDPAAPKARVIAILLPDDQQSATNALRQIRERQAAEAAKNIPPTPGLRSDPTIARTNAPPLPDSSNRTYGEHLDDMARFYNRQSRK